MRRRRLAGLLLASALLLVTIAGCGSDDENRLTSGATSTKQEADAEKGPISNENDALGSSQTGETPKQDTAVGDPVPGSKAVAPGVPVTRGGDNSIQAFGTEGEADPREQAVAGLTAYLDALRSGDWSRACALASEEYRRQLARLVAQAKGKDKPEGCAATLESLLGDAPGAALRAFVLAEALSFRVEGEYAYLIFRNVEGEEMFVAMASEDGEWKVNVLAPEALPAASGG